MWLTPHPPGKLGLPPASVSATRSLRRSGTAADQTEKLEDRVYCGPYTLTLAPRVLLEIVKNQDAPYQSGTEIGPLERIEPAHLCQG